MLTTYQTTEVLENRNRKRKQAESKRAEAHNKAKQKLATRHKQSLHKAYDTQTNVSFHYMQAKPTVNLLCF